MTMYRLKCLFLYEDYQPNKYVIFQKSLTKNKFSNAVSRILAYNAHEVKWGRNSFKN